MERVLVAVVAKDVCGKLIVQGVFVAMVARVARQVCLHVHLVIERVSSCSAYKVCMREISSTKDVCCGSCKGCNVSLLTFGNRKGLRWSSCEAFMWEIIFAKDVCRTGCKSWQVN